MERILNVKIEIDFNKKKNENKIHYGYIDLCDITMATSNIVTVAKMVENQIRAVSVWHEIQVKACIIPIECHCHNNEHKDTQTLLLFDACAHIHVKSRKTLRSLPINVHVY